jgi:2'-hydroxyisoflavone reductase
MSRVLVIGGTLFIGRALVKGLVDRGDDVVIMHRTSGHPFGARVGEILCDRNDTDAVHAALAGTQFDVVYDNVYDFARGTSADQVLAAATAGRVARYVFTSSVAVYHAGGEYDEDAPLVPSSYPNRYGAQKADTERALFALQNESDIAVTTLRPSFVYGPHNPFDREAFFWDRIRDDRPIIVPEDGARTLQWVHVDDVARAAILAADSKQARGRAYHLGNYPPITQVAFVELLARVAGKAAQLVYVPRKVIESAGGNIFVPPYYFGAYLDVPPITILPDRVQSELGLTLTPLEEGMRATYEWYAAQARPTPDYQWEDALLASVR